MLGASMPAWMWILPESGIVLALGCIDRHAYWGNTAAQQ